MAIGVTRSLRGGLGSQEDRQPGSGPGTPRHPQTQCRPVPHAAMCPPLSGCRAPGQLETPVGLGESPRGKVPGLWLGPAEDREGDAPSDIRDTRLRRRLHLPPQSRGRPRFTAPLLSTTQGRPDASVRRSWPPGRWGPPRTRDLAAGQWAPGAGRGKGCTSEHTGAITCIESLIRQGL